MIAPGLAAAVLVSIGYADYRPPVLDVVRGETVVWSQDSSRRHTVTALDDSFDSGPLLPGDSYRRTFGSSGDVPYYCQLHAGITGEVRVREVLLDPPPAAAAGGRPFPLSGRAAAGTATVTVTGDDGSSAEADVDDDGSFTATVVPVTTTTYAAGDSPPVTLRVVDRTVVARRTGPVSVQATVTPASPRQTVVLQVWLPHRFGWWPVDRARLNKASAATLHGRRGRARILLTLPDGATPLAVSPVFRLGPPARSAPAGTS